MKNKVLKLLCVIFVFSLLSVPVSAEPSSFYTGSGTHDDPYLISCPEQLIQLATDVNEGNLYEDTWFRQTADINLAGYPWTPIGAFETEYAFCGTYDGDGHTIYHLSVGPTGNNGMFGKLGGTLMNLSLVDGDVQGACSGSFSSHAYGSEAVIINCFSSSSVSGYRAGGIADNFNGLIANCWTDCSLSATDEGSVGGIVSYWASRVYKSYARGDYNPEKLIQQKGVSMLTEDTSNAQLLIFLNKGLYQSALKAGVDPLDLHYWILNSDGVPCLSADSYQYHLSDAPAYLMGNLIYIVPALLALAGITMLLAVNRKIRKQPK